MDELIATFKSRYPHFAFEDDPAQPWTFLKSAVWGGPGWQKRTATRLEAQYWRTKLRLLSHDAELYEVVCGIDMVTAAGARKILVEVARALVSRRVSIPWESLLPFISSVSNSRQ